MIIASYVAALFVGMVLGFGAAYLFGMVREKTVRELADELFRESERTRQSEFDTVIANLKGSFEGLSLDALKKFSEMAGTQFTAERELHGKELDTKKGLIDKELEKIGLNLQKMEAVVRELEKDREQKFGEVATKVETLGRQLVDSTAATTSLREALSGTKTRGQWGERMAEDVLRLAGFIENVNFQKQKTLEGTGSRPDFTFLLPQNRILNMDVKFPLDNYLRFLDAATDTEREQCRRQFLRDVKARITELTSRDYIDPANNTVDYVLLFIPNEQVFSFIYESDAKVLDDGLKLRVILCSPMTLFAVLAVIRAAVDSFALEQTSNRILSLLGGFRAQWAKFTDGMDTLGKRLDLVRKGYDELTTTRRRQLERPLAAIDALREERGLAVEGLDELSAGDGEEIGNEE